jgi:hypothetical protein
MKISVGRISSAQQRWSITKAARGSFGERFQKRLAAGDQRNFASFSETGTNPSSRCCSLAIQPI